MFLHIEFNILLNHGELFLEISANEVPLDFLFLGGIEEEDVGDWGIFAFKTIVDSTLMFFHGFFGNENIFKFFGNARADFAHKMGFLEMPFDVVIVSIIYILELGVVF